MSVTTTKQFSTRVFLLSLCCIRVLATFHVLSWGRSSYLQTCKDLHVDTLQSRSSLGTGGAAQPPKYILQIFIRFARPNQFRRRDRRRAFLLALTAANFAILPEDRTPRPWRRRSCTTSTMHYPALQGHCGTTNEVASCEDPFYFKGVFSNIDWSRRDTLKQCQKKCTACSRCAFFSYSTTWQDCSWYNDCTLSQKPSNFTSFQMKNVTYNSNPSRFKIFRIALCFSGMTRTFFHLSSSFRSIIKSIEDEGRVVDVYAHLYAQSKYEHEGVRALRSLPQTRRIVVEEFDDSTRLSLIARLQSNASRNLLSGHAIRWVSMWRKMYLCSVLRQSDALVRNVTHNAVVILRPDILHVPLRPLSEQLRLPKLLLLRNDWFMMGSADAVDSSSRAYVELESIVSANPHFSCCAWLPESVLQYHIGRQTHAIDRVADPDVDMTIVRAYEVK